MTIEKKKVNTQPFVLRLDPTAIKMVEQCIPVYGTTKAAVIKQMITEFYNNHSDEIQKTLKSLGEKSLFMKKTKSKSSGKAVEEEEVEDEDEEEDIED